MCHLYSDRHADENRDADYHVDADEYALSVLQLWWRVLSGYRLRLCRLQSGVERGLWRVCLRRVYPHRDTPNADNYAHEHSDKDLDADPHFNANLNSDKDANLDEHSDIDQHTDADHYADVNKDAYREQHPDADDHPYRDSGVLQL